MEFMDAVLSFVRADVLPHIDKLMVALGAFVALCTASFWLGAKINAGGLRKASLLFIQLALIIAAALLIIAVITAIMTP